MWGVEEYLIRKNDDEAPSQLPSISFKVCHNHHQHNTCWSRQDSADALAEDVRNTMIVLTSISRQEKSSRGQSVDVPPH